jgi:hypothetical protein
MAIIQHPFDEHRARYSGLLFSDELEADDWVMFHGTSGFNADTIESDGFVPGRTGVEKSDICAVVKVFDQLKWAGRDPGGLAILKPYSLEYDLKTGMSPVFFGECSIRALTHAARDFAGGEKLRAIRKAIADLELYLADTALRDEHKQSKMKEFDLLTKFDAHPSMLESARPSTIDLALLREQVDALGPLRDLAQSAWDRHNGGVVYALNMGGCDLTSLVWRSAMGIEATNHIPASRIVAKVEIPRDFDSNGVSGDLDIRLRRMKKGLIPAVTRYPFNA